MQEMAEFCKDCFVKICGGSEKEIAALSDELDLCEGCGEYKHVVVDVWPRRDPVDMSWLKDLFKRKK